VIFINLILLGAPGAGKGTQAKLIAEEFEIPHIATGDLLRAAVVKQTELGKQAKVYMTRGELVPDQIVIDMIAERLSDQDAKNGYVLDGFPRTVQQAKKLGQIQTIDMVLNIDVDFALLLERLTGRRSCGECGEVYHIKYNPPLTPGICDKCGAKLYQRTDDKKEVIENRLVTYNNQTKPLVEFYGKNKLLKNVPGAGTIEDIFKSIKDILDKLEK
jgi:adenylate kinase